MELIIRKLELRGELSNDERSALRRTFSIVRSFEPGQDVLIEGEPPAFAGALLQGMICRHKSVSTGERQVVALPLPGDVFDLHSFLLDRMDHSVTAITKATIATAPHAAVEGLFQTFPRLAVLLWHNALVEGSILREWVVNLGRRNAYGRLAHLFCELFVRMRAVGLTSGASYSLPLTQTGLSDVSGLSIVHVNRVLQQLRAEKLITFQKQRLTIENWEGLVAAGTFDPAYLHEGASIAIHRKVSGAGAA